MPETPPARSWAEIDLGAVRHNAEIARLHSGCEVMAIVKANGYGHGAVPVARALCGIATMFGVANLREARELRAGGITEPVLLLSPCLRGEEPLALHDGFHVSVSTLEEAKALDALTASSGIMANAHAVVDTGMGRIGFLESAWSGAMVRQLLVLRNIAWEGLATHLPTPDEDAVFTRAQIQRFGKCVEIARSAGMQPRWIHVASGAGLLGYSEHREVCNLARPGLMLYGVNPFPTEDTGVATDAKDLELRRRENQENAPAQKPRVSPPPRLQQVMTWKTRITLVRELPAGHGISYGRSEILKHPTKVATLACGYADGYPRQVSGKGGVVLIRGTRCPLLGRVTMDQMMVDVTGLAQPAQTGDEVVLLGAQGDEFISSTEIAQKAGTIAWHVFTGITGRVERSYVGVQASA